jgi:hypothetical protein
MAQKGCMHRDTQKSGNAAGCGAAFCGCAGTFSLPYRFPGNIRQTSPDVINITTPIIGLGFPAADQGRNAGSGVARPIASRAAATVVSDPVTIAGRS